MRLKNLVKKNSLSVLCVISVRSGSHVFSSVSVKSDWSLNKPPEFSEETLSSPKRYFTCLVLLITLLENKYMTTFHNYISHKPFFFTDEC